KASRTKTQHCDKLLEQACWPAGIVGISRIRPSNMRTEWAARTRGIRIEGKLVLPNLLRALFDSGKRRILSGNQRISFSRPAHHRCREFLSFRRIAAGLLVDELPEFTDVLVKLTHYHI